MRERLEDTGPCARAYVWGGVSDLFGKDLVGCVRDQFWGFRSEGALTLQELGELVLLDDGDSCGCLSWSLPLRTAIPQVCGGAE